MNKRVLTLLSFSPVYDKPLIMTCLLQGITHPFSNRTSSFSSKLSALIILVFTCCSFSVFAQQSVSGRVTSGDSALANVTVQVKGASTATQTNADGRYAIRVPATATLEFSFVGFTHYETKVNGRTVVNAELQPVGVQMSDVVVVGYGKQRAPTVTGAVSTVTGKELTQTSVANISNMLIGRTSGISGVQASGEPGVNAATIRIRGIATLNGADPLIVIDGIQQPTEQPYVLLNAMDANEIENISVLKDASATAVFGIRGANGVIVITTKRGKANRPQLSFSANQGFTKATAMYETVNATDFALMRNEAVYNAQAAGDFSFNRLLFSDDELWKFQNNRDYTPAQVDAMSNLTAAQREALKNSPALYYTSHNYYEEQFGGTGLQNQYNLNVSGGTAKVKYFTSLGFFNQDGILSNTTFGGSNTNPNFKRYNFRSNLDIDVIKNFQLSVNIGGQSSVNQIAGGVGGDINPGNRYQGIIQNILENAPYVGPGIRDGHLITAFIGTTGDTINPLVNKGGTGFTPIASLLTGGSRRIYTSSLNTVVTLRHTMGYLTKGLESHVRVSYDNSYTKGFTQTNRIPTYSAMRNPADPAEILYIGGVIEPNAAADNQGNSSWRKLYLEAAVNYSRNFGSHNVSGLVLANAQRYSQNNQAFNTASGLMGLVGRATYNFKERYLLEFNMGYNGTENFAPGKRFGYFPAVSAGWILSNESFFKENKWVNFIKLRGSYGEVGNDQIGGSRYLYLPNTWVTNASGYWFGNSNGSAVNPSFSGASESALGNPAVTWERAKKTNVSADLRFLNSRLSVTASWFQEKRNDILWRSSIIPANFGGTVPAQNLGMVSNQGYEIEGSWNDNIGKLAYFVRANYSFARNKIDYMAEAPFPYPWMNQTGFSIGQNRGLLSDGFYNTQHDLNNRPFNSYGNNARLGDIKYVDVTGDGIINQNDQVPIGYANLPQVAYNLTIGLNYKGFDLNALFIGTAKGSFSQFGYILNTPFAQTRGQVLQYAYDGRWTPEKVANGEPITYPAYSFSGGGPNIFSDFWLRPNDFKRLKNLEIGYTFDKTSSLLTRANIRAIRVYANGNNLFTWGTSMIKGIDPEMTETSRSREGYSFPLTRTYNFGVNLQF